MGITGALPSAYLLLTASLVLLYTSLTPRLPFPYHFFTFSIPILYLFLTNGVYNWYPNGMAGVWLVYRESDSGINIRWISAYCPPINITRAIPAAYLPGNVTVSFSPRIRLSSAVSPLEQQRSSGEAPKEQRRTSGE